MKKEMIIAMACTKDWYKYLVVNIYSLLECTKSVKKLYLILETNDIKEVPYLEEIEKKYKVKIEIINFYDYKSKSIDVNSPNIGTIYSDFCFARLMLCDFVKENKVLYIDTDAIVRKDISNVWNYDISDYYVAGVKDYGVYDDRVLDLYNITGKYINSGFVLFNLKKLKKEKIKDKWFEIVNNFKLVFPDQDALNIVCQHNELYIPSMYNSCEYAGDRITLDVKNKDLIKVFHYAGPKEQWVVDRLHGEEWYDSYEKFYNDFVKKVLK